MPLQPLSFQFIRRFLLIGAVCLAWGFTHPTFAQDIYIPPYLYDETEQTVEGELLENSQFHDAGIVAVGDQVWETWLEYIPEQGERLWVKKRFSDQQEVLRSLTEVPGRFSTPTLTCAKDGTDTVWLSYEAEVDGQWDIFVLPVNEALDLMGAVRISEGEGADISHRIAAISDGGIWAVWQSDNGGQFDILARKWTPQDPGRIEVLSESPCGDWRPDVAVLPDGNPVAVWDTFDGNDYEVVLRAMDDGGWGPVRAVTDSDAFEARVRIAANGEGRTVLAWEEGAEKWGHKYVAAYYPQKVFVSLTDPEGPLHRFRKLRFAELDLESNESFQPLPEFPMPSIAEALSRVPTAENALPIGAYYERAEISFDDADRLWVGYRHLYAHLLGTAPDHHYEEGIGVYATTFEKGQWTSPTRLAPDQGDGIQRLSIAPVNGGLSAAWTVGRTDRRPLQRPRGVALGWMGAPLAVESALEPLPPPVAMGTPVVPPPLNDPPSLAFREVNYQLFFGDLHRHTDLSLCMVPADGSIDDAYRYATDLAQHDFFGITDHCRDIAKANPLSLLWWRSTKEVTRHGLTGTFFPYFSYERSREDTDHNVISLRDDMLRSYEPPLPTFWEECDEDTLTIPHQPFFNTGLWEYNNDKLRPLAEIYQGCRDTTATDAVHEGLSRGYHFGFIASSDHLSTNGSFACVWSPKRDKETIFRSMQKRRTYGATDKIELAVHAGDYWMGEKFRIERFPPLLIQAKGTGPISRVSVIVDGVAAETVNIASKAEIRLVRTITLSRGSHYVYVILEQEDGNLAWASPFFVEIEG